MKPTNFTAKVAQPNTPETDADPCVKHVVTYTVNGEKKSMELYAECPMSAISTARVVLSDLYAGGQPS